MHPPDQEREPWQWPVRPCVLYLSPHHPLPPTREIQYNNVFASCAVQSAWLKTTGKKNPKNSDGLKQKGGRGRRKEGFSQNSQEVGGSYHTRNRQEPAGFGVGLPPRWGYRVPWHASFRITFLNLGSVPTAGRGLPRSQWIPPGPAQERSQVLSAPRAPRFIQMTIPNLGSWPWVGWGDRMQPLSKGLHFSLASSLILFPPTPRSSETVVQTLVLKAIETPL